MAAALRISEDELRKILVDRLELISQQEFESATQAAARMRAPIEAVLNDRGVPRAFLMEQLAAEWSVGYTDLRITEVETSALEKLKEGFARQNSVMPFRFRDGKLSLAMTDPRDSRILSEAAKLSGARILPFIAPPASIMRAHLMYKVDLRKMLADVAREGAPEQRAMEQRLANPAELLDRIMEFAAVSQASDIHIEPFETEALVRCRIDGVLQEVMSCPLEYFPAIGSRIKVQAQLRLDEKRTPQDGRFETDIGGLKFDLRVSSLPTRWGEKFVIRVLARETITFDLEHLGLSAEDYAVVLRNLLRPHGMILVTGPTGSGKSTTLYSLLARLGAERKYKINMATVEDPVEYSLPRVNQVSTNEAAGLTFPVALRALLRQDPDVIMVGEIRDRDTADIAVRAALIGRLLFSTLHTNDATAAVQRLGNIGVEPFLLGSTLALVIGQRLVRRICSSCRESVDGDAATLALLRARPDIDGLIRILREQNVLGSGDDPLADVRFYRGKGCAQCQGTGYRGRVGVFETFEVTDAMRSLITQGVDVNSLRAAAIAGGMKTMFHDGLAKAFLGETTLSEVIRVAM